MDDEDYNAAPTQNDKVQVLVYVVPGNIASASNSNVLAKLRDIRNEASDLGESTNQVFFVLIFSGSPKIGSVPNTSFLQLFKMFFVLCDVRHSSGGHFHKS